MISYEKVLERFGSDYPKVKQTDSYEEISSFFEGQVQTCALENWQMFDFQGLQGRFLSSSYAPLPGEPSYEPMLEQLRLLFNQFQQKGNIRFEYHTRLFFGRMQ